MKTTKKNRKPRRIAMDWNTRIGVSVAGREYLHVLSVADALRKAQDCHARTKQPKAAYIARQWEQEIDALTQGTPDIQA